MIKAFSMFCPKLLVFMKSIYNYLQRWLCVRSFLIVSDDFICLFSVFALLEGFALNNKSTPLVPFKYPFFSFLNIYQLKF